MLDMGFVHDIRKVLALLPDGRQNLLFSATMPDSIVKLASGFLTAPVRVEVDPQSTTVERIHQTVMYVDKSDKRRLLVDQVSRPEVESAIVFTRTKHGANRVTKELSKAGIEAAAIHGNKSQGARLRALAGFKSGDLRVLVATDIASRGLDIDGVSHVFNFELPNIPESYVHRIGRTGRAGRDGVAIAFCDDTENAYLRDIEKLIGQRLELDSSHEWHSEKARTSTTPPPKRGQGRPNRGGGGGKPEGSGKGGQKSGRGRRRRPPRRR